MKQPVLRKPWRIISLSTLLVAATHGVPALGDGSWYGSVSGAIGFLDDSRVESPFGGSSIASFDSGFGSGGAIGYDFGNSWRIEGEVMYRSNDIDGLDLASAPAGTRGGDFSSLGIGVNLYRDFDLGGNPDSRGYIGVGLVQLQEIDMDFDTPSGEISYSDSDSGFQVMVGARYRLDRPWYLFSELRYFDAGSVQLAGEGVATGSLRADYATTSLMFGVGYRFR